MTSIFEHLQKVAQEVARNAEARIANLDDQIAKIEEQKTQIVAERAKAREAIIRAANFPGKIGNDNVCPVCWAGEGKMSPLRPVPSGNRNDLFRCSICHYEDAFAP